MRSLSPGGPQSPWRCGASVAVVGLLMLGSAGCRVASRGQNAEGVRLYHQGFYEGAIERFQQAIYNNPENADSYYNLAATYHSLAKTSEEETDWNQSESYYNQCLDHDPEHRDCYRGLAILLVEKGRSDEGFGLLQGWVDRSPSSAAPKIELARLHEEFGDADRSKELLLEAITVDPYNATALAALGHIHESLGNSDQALSDYQRSLWYDHFQPDVASRVAVLERQLNRTSAVAPPEHTRTVTTPSPTLR